MSTNQQPTDLPVPPLATLRVGGSFEGPNFISGIAAQNNDFEVIDSTTAILEFAGGINPAVTYVQILNGSGFGIDGNGRFTGVVNGFMAFQVGTPGNTFTLDGVSVPLDVTNSLANSQDVSFVDELVVPQEYDFYGAEFDDVFINGSYNDTAYGYDGDDVFEGLSGDDCLFGHDGDDVLIGGEGDDILEGGDGSDLINGGIGFDDIRGGNDADIISGGSDNDSIDAGSGDDEVSGDTGSDEIFGRSGDDLLQGGQGSDTIYGGSGSNTLEGGEGSDQLFAGAEADTVDGGAGSDLIYGYAGDDEVSGGDGSDTIFGGGGDDKVDGGNGTNILNGNAGDDLVLGGDGADSARGGSGNDTISSGEGADFIIGDAGHDILSGNIPGGDLSPDTFLFAGNFGDDTITDFEIGFDFILFYGSITADDVETVVLGNNVLIAVDFEGAAQSVLVLGVADSFNKDADIVFD